MTDFEQPATAVAVIEAVPDQTVPERVAEPARRPPVPRPSLTRSASTRRARLRGLAQQGNTRALRHGVLAVVLNGPDVALEVDLVYATHPGLDPMADRRLVELYATSQVQRHRALAAMASEGLTPVLTSYDARLAAMVERLERAVHERERTRLGERQSKRVVDLSGYAPPRKGQKAK